MRKFRVLAVALSLAAGFGGLPPAGTAGAAGADLSTQKLAGSDGDTEPRVTVDVHGVRWLITNSGGTAVVYRSADQGRSWQRTSGDPADQALPTIDVDIAVASSGRLVATELDFGGVNFRTSYSDDGGRTWTKSSGTEYADTDRPWLAAGPGNRVYLLVHNLLSGSATHNMFVATSTDGGATFGPPIPVTLPPSQAWQDLQCADSGGPSNLFTDARNGTVYAVWGTRSAIAGGGCGASVTGPFEINVVAATRVWMAASTDGGLTWSDHLVVDHSADNHIVGMQLAPGAVDSQGNVYVVYPESPGAYPDYDGAAIRYVWASPHNLDRWSRPVTVAASGGAGHVLPHIVAGDPGMLDFAYFTGVTRPGKAPAWYVDVATTRNGLSVQPQLATQRASSIVTYTGTASQLMGACSSNGAENGFFCGRSTDVWGIALDPQCMLTITWPVSGGQNDADPKAAATYVTTQTGGSPACKKRR